MKTMTLAALVAAATLAFCSTSAEAKTQRRAPSVGSPITQFCGDKYCAAGEAARPEPALRRLRAAGKAGRDSARSGITNREPPAAGSGIVRSSKTGATARVAARYQPVFQAYVDDLEAAGAVVRFMGGYRPGTCWTGGRHPCGAALDVCQYRRGVVERKCNLPSPGVIVAIAARHGLTEGASWQSSDYGHAEVRASSRYATRSR